ncbi:hypothetical protein [Streptomyces sp. H27-C3]|nr:hypothetical protein [Streptomyces sp. H27-C3]MDJ0467044.1 hypothetical protein [Streptomyces sp. H27-C3]
MSNQAMARTPDERGDLGRGALVEAQRAGHVDEGRGGWQRLDDG